MATKVNHLRLFSAVERHFVKSLHFCHVFCSAEMAACLKDRLGPTEKQLALSDTTISNWIAKFKEITFSRSNDAVEGLVPSGQRM